MESAIASIRKRPAMFVGGTGSEGVEHMVHELVANAYDQYLAGRCTRVSVHITADGTITVEDNGPGIPAAGSATLPPLPAMLTVRSDKPTVDGHRPHAHIGIGALGLVTVNALSEWFEIVTVHDGVEARAVYACGEVVEPVATLATKRGSGTRIRFRPDASIFGCLSVSRTELTKALDDLTFLAPGLQLTWTFAGDDFATHGLAGLVATRARCAVGQVAHHRARFETAKGPLDVEVALAWPRWEHEPTIIDSFVNLGRTPLHGFHVTGLIQGVAKFLACTPTIAARAGFSAAVAVVLADVIYGRPTKERLESPEVRAPVAAATRTALDAWAAAHPALATEARRRKPRK